jgi:hypothetical protein
MQQNDDWQYDNNDALLEVFGGSMPAFCDRLGRQAMGRRSQLAVLIPSKTWVDRRTLPGVSS